jgi:hypothetical protein
VVEEGKWYFVVYVYRRDPFTIRICVVPRELAEGRESEIVEQCLEDMKFHFDGVSDYVDA